VRVENLMHVYRNTVLFDSFVGLCTRGEPRSRHQGGIGHIGVIGLGSHFFVAYPLRSYVDDF